MHVPKILAVFNPAIFLLNRHIKCTTNITMFTYESTHIFMLNLVLKERSYKRYLCRVNTSDLYAGYQSFKTQFFEKFREIELNKYSAKFSIILLFHATLRLMCYDNDIDKYKCGPAVTTSSDVASPNAVRTSSVLLLIYS